MTDIRHQIDTLTAEIPDGLTRTDIATLAIAMHVDGMATAMEACLHNPALVSSASALRQASARCGQLYEELMGGMS